MVSLIFERIASYGMLPQTDACLPSIVSLIVGEPVRGSWWGHPRGGEIYNLLGEIADHDDIEEVRLIDGKVTYIHRRLWPALIGVATSGEAWQLRNLSPAAGKLLAMVNKMGECRLDRISIPDMESSKKPGDVARDLERRLLLHGWQIHTERGAHTKCLATWERWMKHRGIPLPEITVDAARRELDTHLVRLNTESGGNARLAWWKRG
jgi:hypothetical protein